MGRHTLAVVELNLLGDVFDEVNHAAVGRGAHARLGVIAELYGLAHDDAAAGRLQPFGDDVEEGALAHAVGTDDAYLLAALEDVGIVVDEVAIADVVQLQYLAADALGFDGQLRTAVVEARVGFSLKLIESVNACLCFGAAGLRHAAHPFELGAVKAACLSHLGALVGLALGLLLQIVVVAAFIVIEARIVEFVDVVANVVEEVAVVGHHKDCQPLAREELLEPLNHVYIQVVGGLVEDEQVTVVHEQAAECHLLLLAAAEGVHLTVKESVDTHAAKYLLHALLEGPFVLSLGALHIVDEVAHLLLGVSFGALRQIGQLEVAAEGYLACILQGVVTFLASGCHYYIQQRRLAVAVACYQCRLLSGVDAKGDVFEEELVAEALGETFDSEQCVSHYLVRFSNSSFAASINCRNFFSACRRATAALATR